LLFYKGRNLFVIAKLSVVFDIFYFPCALERHNPFPWSQIAPCNFLIISVCYGALHRSHVEGVLPAKQYPDAAAEYNICLCLMPMLL